MSSQSLNTAFHNIQSYNYSLNSPINGATGANIIDYNPFLGRPVSTLFSTAAGTGPDNVNSVMVATYAQNNTASGVRGTNLLRNVDTRRRAGIPPEYRYVNGQPIDYRYGSNFGLYNNYLNSTVKYSRDGNPSVSDYGYPGVFKTNAASAVPYPYPYFCPNQYYVDGYSRDPPNYKFPVCTDVYPVYAGVYPGCTNNTW